MSINLAFLLASVSVGVSASGLIRFCNGTSKIEFLASNCTGGILIPKNSLDPDWSCVCATDAWFVSTSICKSTPESGPTVKFIYTNSVSSGLKCLHRSSFAAQKNAMTYASFLGSTQGLGENGPVLLTSSDGVIVQPTATAYGFHFNIHPAAQCHRNGHKSTFWIILVDSGKRWGTTLNDEPYALCLLPHIFVAGNISTYMASSEGTFMYDVSSLCINRNNIPQEALFLTIVEDCEYENGAEWFDVLPSKVNDLDSTDEDVRGACAACGQMPDESENGNQCSGDCVVKDILNENLLEYDVDLQSSRMGLQLLSAILKPTPPENFENLENFQPFEIKMLTKSALIAIAACDPSAIPVTFYKYFLFMFKVLLFETTHEISRQSVIPPENQQWISQALARCRQRTSNYEVKFEKKCHSTHHTSKHSKRKTGKSPDIPGSIKWNTNYDMLLELVWKLSSFLIYHCYEDFAEGTTYHYELRALLEGMFTEDIQRRWNTPSNANKMYTHLLEPHLNLTLTLTNFDLCVGAAHAQSQYANDMWLKRPIDIHSHVVPQKEMPDPEMNRNEKPTDSIQMTNASKENLFIGKFCFSDTEALLSDSKIRSESCW